VHVLINGEFGEIRGCLDKLRWLIIQTQTHRKRFHFFFYGIIVVIIM